MQLWYRRDCRAGGKTVTVDTTDDGQLRVEVRGAPLDQPLVFLTSGWPLHAQLAASGVIGDDGSWVGSATRGYATMWILVVNGGVELDRSNAEALLTSFLGQADVHVEAWREK